ncbi:hypothetical protein [Pseudomonas sp. S31]|uniref:hypothetical protein n=1 Tax=Pseudomonas sp. S31 TaxID=1564473 RepID=UPI001913D960|nr:hypothetical protein [Pseudomonas sp. S31]
MIEIDLERLAEPAEFDTKCRKKGEQWLRDNPKVSRTPKTRPRDFWSPFRSALADGYQDRCGYSAMYEPVGTVDHFLPVDADESLSYEWTNYRFCSGWINSSKRKSVEILDPHLVREGWFEVLLPSLQLVVVLEKVPEELRVAATETLTRLHLRDDERVLRQRRAWYSKYQEGKINLDGLREVAPLIAAAVERLDAQ